MEVTEMATMQSAVVGFSWTTAVDLSTKENRARLSPSAIKGLIRIAAHWKLRDDDTRALLGGMSTGSFYPLKNQAAKTLSDRSTHSGFAFDRDIQGTEHSV